MIVFFFCWIFFFLHYTICTDEILSCENYFGKRVYVIVVDILFWIGYLNSMANFFMYALANKDFDRAFRSLLGFDKNENVNLLLKIFCCKKQPKNTVVRRRDLSSLARITRPTRYSRYSSYNSN